MSFFSDAVSLEGLFRLCQIVAWIAGLLAVLALLGKDITQRMIADRQAKETTAARAAQVEAERKLDELRQRQRAYESLRSISANLPQLLADKPKGQAVVVYIGGSSDVIGLAESLVRALNKAGWEVPQATPITSVIELMPKTRAAGDIVIACAGRSGVPTHIGTLMHALSKEPYPYRVSAVASSSHEFPDDRPRIIVNPRF